MDDRRWSQAGRGGLLIAVGAVLIGHQAGVWDIGYLARWWPLGLIVMGLGRGVRTREGVLWMGWGGLLLLSSTQVWPWRESWPVLLVMYGVALMVWPSGCAAGRRDGSRVG